MMGLLLMVRCHLLEVVESDTVDDGRAHWSPSSVTGAVRAALHPLQRSGCRAKGRVSFRGDLGASLEVNH